MVSSGWELGGVLESSLGKDTVVCNMPTVITIVSPGLIFSKLALGVDGVQAIYPRARLRLLSLALP